jgi:predicted lipoprotein with Yx(FWY)xxD motif
MAMASACGSSNSSSTPASTPPASTPASSSGGVTISTATVSGLGTVLVNGQGKTLYIFEPDKHAKVTCTGGCAAIWPPAALTAGQKAVAAGGVNAKLLGSDPNPSGGSVVTYNGWPLYTYVTDSSAGQATGQGINSSGGLWYVISPSGTVITKAP